MWRKSRNQDKLRRKRREGEQSWDEGWISHKLPLADCFCVRMRGQKRSNCVRSLRSNFTEMTWRSGELPALEEELVFPLFLSYIISPSRAGSQRCFLGW